MTLVSGRGRPFAVEGQLPASREAAPRPSIVSPRRTTFATIGIPLLRGRHFSPADGPDAPAVAIVNQTLARTSWPNEDPIGRRLQLLGTAGGCLADGDRRRRATSRSRSTRALRCDGSAADDLSSGFAGTGEQHDTDCPDGSRSTGARRGRAPADRGGRSDDSGPGAAVGPARTHGVHGRRLASIPSCSWGSPCSRCCSRPSASTA